MTSTPRWLRSVLTKKRRLLPEKSVVGLMLNLDGNSRDRSGSLCEEAWV